VPEGATNKAWNLAAFDKAPKALLEIPKPPEPIDTGTAQTNTNALRLAMIV
jgi:hypothetical protein